MILQKAFDRITKFISFWYMRYLLSTELYIVEPWERAVTHIIMVLVLVILSYINMGLLNYLSYAIPYIRTLF